jgi:hypothetical protein
MNAQHSNRSARIRSHLAAASGRHTCHARPRQSQKCSTWIHVTRRVATVVVTTIAVSLAVAPAAPAAQPVVGAAAPTSSSADTVIAWNAIAMSTLVGAAVPIPEQPLYLAYLHRSVYKAAVRAIQHHASVPAAVVAAAHRILVTYFPAQHSTLDIDYSAALASIPAGVNRRAGIAIGRREARALVRERADDGRNGPPLPTAAPGPGVWIPTPPNTVGASSWLGAVRPFVLASGDEFRPNAPPALTSARWAADYNEVRTYGSATSTVRTAKQTEIARFWGDPPYVQNQRALRTVVADRGLDAVHAAQLFAMADTAAADALIACWDTKYHYWLWRPFSAIPGADTDGNPATPADPSWTPLLPTPNHPDYASAHSCATTALFTVVARLLSPHTDALEIDIDSGLTATTHHFATVGDLMTEVANARVWAGLHWRFSTAAGERIGKSVALLVLRTGGKLARSAHEPRSR